MYQYLKRNVHIPMGQSSNTVLVTAFVRHTLQCMLSVCPDAWFSVTHGRVLMHEYQLHCLGNDVLATVVSRCAGHVFLLRDPGTLLRPASTTAVIT